MLEDKEPVKKEAAQATTLNDLQDCPVHSRQAVPHIQMTQLLESLQPIQGPQPFDVAEFQGAECWPQWHQPADTALGPVLILFQVQVAEVVVVARLNTKPQPAVCNAQELQAAAHIVGHCQLTMTFGKHTATTANTQLQLAQEAIALATASAAEAQAAETLEAAAAAEEAAAAKAARIAAEEAF